MRRGTALIPVAVAAFSLLGTAFAPAANAAIEEEVATGLIGPLSLAVAPDGTAYVAQSFASILTEAVPGGDQTDIYADEGGREVAGVSVEGDVITFATTRYGPNPGAHIYQLGPGGQTMLANLWQYEKANNPDGNVKYGVKGLSRSCKKKKSVKYLLPYKGIKESHPYATNVAGDGITYVADAAANAILSVTDAGVIDTVAVLPPTTAKITKSMRRDYGLPKCTKGKMWRAEGVPTDVEMGPDGNLYVTSLPGGHETDGRVYQVNPATGTVTKIAGGLVMPTGLAIAPNGTAYIAQLGAGVIMQQPFGGEPSVFAEVPFPGDVEVIDGYVYATETNLTGENEAGGRVLRWALPG